MFNIFFILEILTGNYYIACNLFKLNILTEDFYDKLNINNNNKTSIHVIISRETYVHRSLP